MHLLLQAAEVLAGLFLNYLLDIGVPASWSIFHFVLFMTVFTSGEALTMTDWLNYLLKACFAFPFHLI